MPQNKSTSRIAAITGKLVVTFAALLAPAILIAETTNVTFDAALTNETGWVYSDKILSSNEGGEHPYFRTIGSYIESQQFSFNVTSITIRLSCSSTSATRHLQIGPTLDIGQQTTGVAEKDKQESQTFVFDAASNMRSFLISLKGSGTTGNWHVYSATISGVPIIDAPTNLQADDIKGTRFRLSWTNPENAVSNRIEVLEIVETETSGGSILEYDFNDFTNNSGSATDITDDFTNAIPAFAGSSLIRLPANTNGIIQISKDTAKGYLVHSGFADYSSMSLAMSIRRPTSDHGKTFGIGYLSAEGTTNEFATFSLEVEFRTNTVSLASVPANASIILNTQGANSKRVVYIDYMAFIGDSLSTDLSTNLAKTAFVADSTTYSVRGLCPRTEYIARITAFDAEGNESSPSEPLAVTTNGDAIPFSIRIR
ncbi:MAG: fibronectin type III domain-containing protein [Lentisphaerae bacterium]|nr:fibronectin type III domain-containing protein [Lentisphaerota bacterium]